MFSIGVPSKKIW